MGDSRTTGGEDQRGCVRKGIGFLLDYPIRARQHVWWNRQPDLLGRLKIDHQLELCRLLHRKIGWLSTLKDFVHVDRRAPEQVGPACGVRHKPSDFDKLALRV